MRNRLGCLLVRGRMGISLFSLIVGTGKQGITPLGLDLADLAPIASGAIGESSEGHRGDES